MGMFGTDLRFAVRSFARRPRKASAVRVIKRTGRGSSMPSPAKNRNPHACRWLLLLSNLVTTPS